VSKKSKRFKVDQSLPLEVSKIVRPLQRVEYFGSPVGKASQPSNLPQYCVEGEASFFVHGQYFVDDAGRLAKRIGSALDF
jgi:hypothetical protein